MSSILKYNLENECDPPFAEKYKIFILLKTFSGFLCSHEQNVDSRIIILLYMQPTLEILWNDTIQI